MRSTSSAGLLSGTRGDRDVVRRMDCQVAAHASVSVPSANLHHIQVGDGGFERAIHPRIAEAPNIGLHKLHNSE